MSNAETERHWTTARLLFNTGVGVFWSLVLVAVVLWSVDWVLRPGTYPVTEVSIEGSFRHVSQAEVERVALPELTGSFITVDLVRVKQQVEALPWVEQAWVSRRWPSGVHVRFTEQHFVARWGDKAWLNAAGAVVVLPAHDGPGDVVQLLGPDGLAMQVLERYRAWSSQLTQQQLTIAALELTERRMWRVVLTNGTEIIVGKDQADERIVRLMRAYESLRPYADQIRRIDMRYANGMALAWRGGRPESARSLHGITR
jgi:cell division protein FtsQ